MPKLKRNWLASSKWTWQIWRILLLSLENLKHFHFNRMSLTKIYNVWAKKLQRSYVWWYWILMQNLIENWLVVSKMRRGISKIFTRHLKVSKLGLWFDSFIQSRKCMSVKFTWELCVMKMKNDANWKRNWLVVSKLSWEIWRIWTNGLKIFKDLYFNGLCLIKVHNFWAKKLQRSYVSWHRRLTQNLKENVLALSKMTWRIWQTLLYRLKNGNSF